MHLPHLRIIKLYKMNNLAINSKFFTQIEEKSIWRSLMTTLKKPVSLTKLLLLTCQSKTKKSKELTTLLWVLFELFLPIKNFPNHYKLKLQKRLFIYGIKVLSVRALYRIQKSQK